MEETRVPEEIEAMRLVAANIIVCVYCFLFSKREKYDDNLSTCLKGKSRKIQRKFAILRFLCVVLL